MASDEHTRPDPRRRSGAFHALPAEIGSYRLVEAIGEGGMADVYRAFDLELKRPVALKVLKDSHLRRRTVLKRFLREARAIARLSHPHVVTIHDVGEFDGRPYLVMEHIEGTPFDRVLEEGRGSLEERLRILVKVARGVEAAHRAGIVHRDLKPSNILVAASGEPKVVDFGLAHLEESETALTRSEAVLGTPRYMAPEQVRGGSDAIGPWTDVHALGAILYQIASGRTPFSGDTQHEVYHRILSEVPRPLRRVDPGIPEPLERIARVALEKDPADRYPTAETFAADLERYLGGRPVLARPVPRVLRLWRRSRAARVGLVAIGVAAVLGGGIAAAGLLARGGAALERVADPPAEGRSPEAARLVEEARPLAGAAIEATYSADSDLDAAHQAADRAARALEEAIRLDPELAAAHHLLGVVRRDQSRFDEAEASCREALRLDPGLLEARVELGRILLDRGFIATLRTSREDDEARHVRIRRAGEAAGAEIHEAASAGAPVELEALLAAGLSAYGDREAMRRIASDGLGRFGTAHGSEYFHLLDHFAAAEPEAGEALEHALRLRPGLALALVMRSGRRYDAGDLEGAGADCETAIRSSPRLAEAYLNRGTLRAGRSDLEGACADFARALELRPDLSAAAVNRANARYREGDVEGALADYDLAIQISPDDVDALHNRGIARQKSGDVRGAFEDFDHLVRLRPLLAEAWFERGNALLELEDLARAMADFDEAIRLDPRFAKAHLNRANARADLGDTSGAFADYDTALELDPELHEAHFNRGNLCRDLGRIDEAIEEFTAVIRIVPRFAAAYYNRGNVYRAKGDTERALADYTQTVRLQPRFFSGWLNRAACHAALGDYAAAILDYTEAIALDGRQPDAWFNRAVTRQAAGDREGAIADLVKALEVAPSSWDSRSKTLRRLAELREGR